MKSYVDRKMKEGVSGLKFSTEETVDEESEGSEEQEGGSQRSGSVRGTVLETEEQSRATIVEGTVKEMLNNVKSTVVNDF